MGSPRAPSAARPMKAPKATPAINNTNPKPMRALSTLVSSSLAMTAPYSNSQAEAHPGPAGRVARSGALEPQVEQTDLVQLPLLICPRPDSSEATPLELAGELDLPSLERVDGPVVRHHPLGADAGIGLLDLSGALHLQ